MIDGDNEDIVPVGGQKVLISSEAESALTRRNREMVHFTGVREPQRHEDMSPLSPSKRIQAIETTYAGCRFRSRLEARWAVFFDHIGMKWQYETEGYELPSGRYLPDFFLPSINTWVEVKGNLEHFDGWETLGWFALRVGAVLVVSDLPRPGEGAAVFPLLTQSVGVECPPFDPVPLVTPEVATWVYFGVLRDGSGARLCLPPLHSAGERLPAQAVVERGFSTARSARFEHGESP